MVEGITLSQMLLLDPAPVAGHWAVVLFGPCKDACLLSASEQATGGAHTGAERDDPDGKAYERFSGGRSVDDEGA